MSSRPSQPAGDLRLLVAHQIPLMPALQMFLAAYDDDQEQLGELYENADPQLLIASLLKLCAFLGIAAYAGELRAQLAELAADRDLAGEAVIRHG